MILNSEKIHDFFFQAEDGIRDNRRSSVRMLSVQCVHAGRWRDQEVGDHLSGGENGTPPHGAHAENTGVRYDQGGSDWNASDGTVPCDSRSPSGIQLPGVHLL